MVKYDICKARQVGREYWGVGLRRRSVQGLSKTSGAATCKLCSSEHSKASIRVVRTRSLARPGLVWSGLVWSGFGLASTDRMGWDGGRGGYWTDTW